jgi:pimeloyl-ACP methyl ester carboxylesterase
MSEQNSDMADRSSVDGRAPGLLAAFAGARPPAPAWADAALAQTPEAFSVTVEGAEIEALAWGPRGAPGLLMLHGNGAHARWWSPLAPFFAADGFRVVALSFSGMGGSQWRTRYSAEIYAQEMLAVSAAGGLTRPLLMAHSFGGFIALHAAVHHAHAFDGLISIDSPIEPPDWPRGGPPRRTKANPVYATLPEILARFRLAPPQGCENLWYLDHIARGSVREAEGGYTWRFDPFVMSHMDMESPALIAGKVPGPMAVIYGDRSWLMPPAVVAYMKTITPPGTAFVPIPEAEHHLMLDQPLPFVAAVRALLGAWGRGSGVARPSGAV